MNNGTPVLFTNGEAREIRSKDGFIFDKIYVVKYFNKGFFILDHDNAKRDVIFLGLDAFYGDNCDYNTTSAFYEMAKTSYDCREFDTHIAALVYVTNELTRSN